RSEFNGATVLTGPFLMFFFFSSRRRHTRSTRDWSSDVCSSDLWPKALNYPILRNSGNWPSDSDSIVPPQCSYCGYTVSRIVKKEIGRASCRERVYIGVGDGCVKKRSWGMRWKRREDMNSGIGCK